MKKLLITTALIALTATGAQARDNLSIGVGINTPVYQPAPRYYENVQIRPAYRPYYPVGYRSGYERHREYDYGYWENHDRDGRWRDDNDRHDNGKHKGWEKH